MKTGRRALGQKLFPYAMCAPGILLFTLFVLVPFLIGIYISLHSWDGLGPMKWLGLKNYGYVLKDKVFWQAMRNTFLYAVVVTIVKNLAGLCLAMLVAKSFVGRTAFRVAIYMPVTFSYVVIGALWSWIYNPTFGILNGFLNTIGAGALIQGWLSDPSIALFSVIFVDIWKWTGFHMVLYLAGIQGIPKDYYEAASIDGATKLQQFFRITVPQLNSTIVINILLSLTGAFVSNYDIVNIMTGGGPFHSTEVSLTYIVATGFRLNSMGKASAMSIVLFAFVAVFGFLQMRTMTRDENYEG